MRLSSDIPIQVFHENHRDETGARARLSTFDGFARRPRFAGSSVAGRTFLIAHFRLRELPRRHGHGKVNQNAAYLFRPETPPLPSSCIWYGSLSSVDLLSHTRIGFATLLPVHLHFARVPASRFGEANHRDATKLTNTPKTLNGRAGISRRRRGAAGAVDC